MAEEWEPPTNLLQVWEMQVDPERERQYVNSTTTGFFASMIQANMESREDNRRKFREHMDDMDDKCAKLREQWAQPNKEWGFWKSEAMNVGYKNKIANNGNTNSWQQVLPELDSIFSKKV